MKPYEGMAAVLYARVSTDDKEQTTATQIREMRAWCELNGVEALAIYEDEKSGATTDRPEWDRLIGRLARGGVNILLAWSESRITRNTDDMVEIQRLLRSFGVVLRYASSATAPETPEGGLINHIGAWQAQQEREKLSINTRNGMLTRKMQGIHCGRPLALVLAHNLDRERARVRDSTKIVTVEAIMAYATAGWTPPATARAIGVSTPTLKKTLADEGLLEEFYGRNKGVTKTRVEKINIEEEKA